MMRIVVFAALCVALAFSASPLQSYNVDPSSVTVSGLSAGAFAAIQYHVAFSKQVFGAGVFAGGPYYCSQGQLATAFTNCMYVPSGTSVSALVNSAMQFASQGNIDPLSNLAGSRLFFYSGTADSVVAPGSVHNAQQWYQSVAPSANISSQYAIPSQHCFPTTDYGNACSYLGSPFINNCGYDGAGAMLTHMYDNLKPAGSSVAANIFSFDQTEFCASPTSKGLDTTGYIYVPTQCQSKSVTCKLHIALHGCEQPASSIGDAYYGHTGINDWAETNNIIVLYPQAHSIMLTNPNACFDWWGYTNSAFAWKSGVQMAAFNKMQNRVLGRA